MKKWEYKFVTLNLDKVPDAESLLSGKGKKGWEVISMVAVSRTIVILMKKEKSN